MKSVMKKFMYQLAILIAPFAFAMCSENGNIPVESNWELEYIYSNGAEVTPPEDHDATIAFLKDSQIAGDTGCNRFFGNFTATDDKLEFNNIGSTRMMCPQMQFESAFLSTMENTASYNVSKDQLVLKDSLGNVIALLKKIEPVAQEN